MKQYTIYMHISPSNKRYIGITSTKVEYRWRSGKGYKQNKHFTNAINKYGWENFQHIIIAKGLTEDIAKWLEIELIRIWDSTNQEKGYNISLGGESSNGCKWTDEQKEKISKENSHMYGKHHTEETKEKISQANKGKVSHMYGKHHTEETKEKISQAKKGKYCGYENHIYNKGDEVICITTMEIFPNCTRASEEYKKYGCHTENIRKCCKGDEKYMSSGKLKNGIPLVWVYYKDFLKMTKEEVKIKLEKAIEFNDKRVICITTMEVFNSSVEGGEYYNCDPSSIRKCCKGKKGYKTCGKLKDGTPLVWKKFTDYLKNKAEG